MNPHLTTLMDKLEMVETELTNDKGEDDYSEFMNTQKQHQLSSKAHSQNSHLILSDILHSFSLASVGSGNLDLESDEMEKLNLFTEISDTLHGTQIKTAKRLLSRIQTQMKVEHK